MSGREINGQYLALRKFPGFQRCLAMMRKSDNAIAEEGFSWLASQAGDFVLELVDAYEREDDIAIKRWLLELIGEAGVEETTETLVSALSSDDESLRAWAKRGLENVGSKRARIELFRHRLARPTGVKAEGDLGE